MSQSTLNFTEQAANLHRVDERIGALVVGFFSARKPGDQFHMAELTRFVAAIEQVAPDSPGRIMRSLRKRGVINYEVVSRSQSLYVVKEAGSEA